MSTFIAIFYFSCSFLSVSASLLLTCSQSNFTCPGSVVNCKCQARSFLSWTVTSQVTGERLLSKIYSRNSRDIGDVTSPNMNGYSVVLFNVDTSSTFTSALYFMFTENVSVRCRTVTSTLWTAGNYTGPGEGWGKGRH